MGYILLEKKDFSNANNNFQQYVRLEPGKENEDSERELLRIYVKNKKIVEAGKLPLIIYLGQAYSHILSASIALDDMGFQRGNFNENNRKAEINIQKALIALRRAINYVDDAELKAMLEDYYNRIYKKPLVSKDTPLTNSRRINRVRKKIRKLIEEMGAIIY